MQSADVSIEIDGRAYATDFQGFDTPMNAYALAGAQVRLQPWRLSVHLSALAECVIPTRQGVALNARAFSRKVLDNPLLPESLHEIFAPLALWWASGGEATPEALDGGWNLCGSVRVLLRPWSSGERFSALSRCRLDAGDGTRFNLSAYLVAMLEASVVAMEPSRPLQSLDSSATCALLKVVIALNAPDFQESRSVFPDLPEADRLTLRLCKVLGWTPSQVWATPAPEMDRLLAMLDRIDSAESRRPALGSGLAQHPDAVVIRIEDD